MSNRPAKKQVRKSPSVKSAAPATSEVEFNPDYSRPKKTCAGLASWQAAFLRFWLSCPSSCAKSNPERRQQRSAWRTFPGGSLLFLSRGAWHP